MCQFDNQMVFDAFQKKRNFNRLCFLFPFALIIFSRSDYEWESVKIYSFIDKHPIHGKPNIIKKLFFTHERHLFITNYTIIILDLGIAQTMFNIFGMECGTL